MATGRDAGSGGGGKAGAGAGGSGLFARVWCTAPRPHYGPSVELVVHPAEELEVLDGALGDRWLVKNSGGQVGRVPFLFADRTNLLERARCETNIDFGLAALPANASPDLRAAHTRIEVVCCTFHNAHHPDHPNFDATSTVARIKSMVEGGTDVGDYMSKLYSGFVTTEVLDKIVTGNDAEWIEKNLAIYWALWHGHTTPPNDDLAALWKEGSATLNPVVACERTEDTANSTPTTPIATGHAEGDMLKRRRVSFEETAAPSVDSGGEDESRRAAASNVVHIPDAADSTTAKIEELKREDESLRAAASDVVPMFRDLVTAYGQRKCDRERIVDKWMRTLNKALNEKFGVDQLLSNLRARLREHRDLWLTNKDTYDEVKKQFAKIKRSFEITCELNVLNAELGPPWTDAEDIRLRNCMDNMDYARRQDTVPPAGWAAACKIEWDAIGDSVGNRSGAACIGRWTKIKAPRFSVLEDAMTINYMRHDGPLMAWRLRKQTTARWYAMFPNDVSRDLARNTATCDYEEIEATDEELRMMLVHALATPTALGSKSDTWTNKVGAVNPATRYVWVAMLAKYRVAGPATGGRKRTASQPAALLKAGVAKKEDDDFSIWGKRRKKFGQSGRPSRPTGIQYMTKEEAKKQAVAEGLTLRRSSSQSGWFSVQRNPNGTYYAIVRIGVRSVRLGTYAVAEHAALDVARHFAPDPPRKKVAEGSFPRFTPKPRAKAGRAVPLKREEVGDGIIFEYNFK